MPVRHERDEVTDVVERCRAYWLTADVPKPAADEMALELEAHLREHRAAGGQIEAVIGTDPRGFADAWASERRRPPPRAVRLLRASNGPVTTAATYVLIAHAVEWVRGDPALLLIQVSDLVWLAAVVVVVGILAAPRNVRRFILPGWRGAPALVFIFMLVLVPIALPVVARTVGAFGAVLFGWPWWASLLLVTAAVAPLVVMRNAA